MGEQDQILFCSILIKGIDNMLDHVKILLIGGKPMVVSNEGILLQSAALNYESKVSNNIDEIVDILKSQCTYKHNVSPCPTLAILGISEELLLSPKLINALEKISINRQFQVEIYFLVDKIIEEHKRFERFKVHFIKKPLDKIKLKTILEKYALDNELANML